MFPTLGAFIPTGTTHLPVVRNRPFVVAYVPHPSLFFSFLRSSPITHSGLVHQLAQMMLAELVSLCWAKSSVLRFIQAMKFLELVGGNMLAITNLAICINLALIVSVRFFFLW